MIILVFIGKTSLSERVERCAKAVVVRRAVYAEDQLRMGFVPVAEKRPLIAPVSRKKISAFAIVQLPPMCGRFSGS